MSQRSLPKSPKSPRSKSPSCDLSEGQEVQPGEENDLQRAIEEELRSPDRTIHESRINSRGGQSNGYTPTGRGGSYHQPSPFRSPAAPQSCGTSPVQSKPPSGYVSRTASSRARTPYEDEPLQLPSTPHSTVTFGSRVTSTGQRGLTPEHGSKPGFQMSSDYEGTPQSNQQSSGRSTGTKPSFQMTSDYEGTPQSNQQSSGRSTGTKPSFQMTSDYEGALQSNQQSSGRSTGSKPSFQMTSDYEGALQSNQQSSGRSGSNMYSAMEGIKSINKSGMSCEPENEDGEVFEAPSYGNATSPRSTSGGIRCPSNVGGQAGMNSAASSGKMGMCSSGCKKYRTEPDEPQEASEAPSFSMRPHEHPSARCFEDRKTPLGCLERTRGGTPTSDGPPPYSSPRQPYYKNQTARSPSPAYDRSYPSPGHVHNTPMKPPQVGRGPEKPMTAGTGAQASSHHHHQFHESYEHMNQLDEKAMSAIAHLSQLRRTPSYVQCGLNQGLDFLNICCQNKSDKKREKITNLPQKPCLRQEQIQELINCETQDVESAWYLTSDERKTYKKPCPKQQKAKMTVKALVQAHTQAKSCSDKEYSPLEHPDPEDISPEVAASMMFSEERGIKMEECPYDTIANLFPDEPKPPFPEKLSQNRLSVVDRSSKDQEEIIEKSATVPSEGVSDSAYTRRMRGRGEDMGPQRSFDVDFAIGQSKREYVLVAQTPQRINKIQYRGGNPPPWFPGYFSAFPNEEGIKIVKSPSSILNTAWMHSNPKNVPTTDVIVLD